MTSSTCSARRSCSRSARSPRTRPRDRRSAGGSSRSGRRRPGSRISPATRPPPVVPLGLAVLAEELRPDARETIAFLKAEGVDIKVLSGDAPATVGSVAADAGLEFERAYDGRELPERRRRAARLRARRDRDRAHLAGRQARGRRGPDPSRALRGDARRRGQRRSRASRRPARDRPGQRRPDGEGDRGRRARHRRLLGPAPDGRRRQTDPPQHPARDDAVRRQVGLRGVPDPLDRPHTDRLSAAPAPSDGRGVADRRHTRRSSSRSPRATGPGASRGSSARWAVSRCRRVSRPASGPRELPRHAQRARRRSHGGAQRRPDDADPDRPLSRARARGA